MLDTCQTACRVTHLKVRNGDGLHSDIELVGREVFEFEQREVPVTGGDVFELGRIPFMDVLLRAVQ